MANSVNYSPTVLKDRPYDHDAVGTIPSVSGLSVEETGIGPFRQTEIRFTNMSMTITDALAYASQKIYDFPKGRINVIDAVARITATTTSALASTLNASSTVSWGFGSAAASNTTLATTMMNFVPGSGESVKTLTSSATINVASAAATGILAAVSAAQLAAKLDGTSTAPDIYLNLAVPTGTDIDADATVTISGHLTISWFNAGVTDALTTI